MVVKMVVDNATIDIGKENYELFCDVKTFLHFMLLFTTHQTLL
jgi:hypothetical protein